MSIEVITGGMFSGKTEELLRRCRRADYAKMNTLLIKPAVDNRYAEKAVVSHSGTRYPSALVSSAGQVWSILVEAENNDQRYDIVAFDEAQFLEDLPEVCNKLAGPSYRHRVIVAGLDMNSDGEPYLNMARLMAMAESVTKLHAICVRCGNEASFSHYKGTKDGDDVLIGGSEAYEALCRPCFTFR